MWSPISRRGFLQASAVTAVAVWTPIGRMGVADAATGTAPPDFPSDICLYKRVFENWALEIRVDDVWTCAPTSAEDIVTVANWALAHGWQVRPLGRAHGWSPFTVLPDASQDAQILLVDTTADLTAIKVDAGSRTVTAQAGALMDDIMAALQANGLGFTSIPAPGDITVAGAIAVNGHGAAVPAAGENTAGRSYGSLSNRITSMTIVAWDPVANAYGIRTVQRGDPLAKALLTNLGRAFVTEVTLKAEQNVNLRCVSRVDLTTDTLFQPTAGPQSFMSFVEQAGRVEAIWYPYTTKPWLKIWSIAPTRPLASREVDAPYNYVFSDTIPLEVARLVNVILDGEPQAAVQLGQVEYDTTATGLLATLTQDIWGKARNTQHYILPSTLRAAEFGWGIMTSRGNVQSALHDLTTKISQLLADDQTVGVYPCNVAVELRCSGVDDPSYVGMAGAEPPVLSALAPRPDHPEWDTVIWANVLCLVGTPNSFPFRHLLEDWIIGHYVEPAATARVEWSKGWGFTDTAGWSNQDVLGSVIPGGYRAGRTASNDWDWAIARLNELDPNRVFSNAFLSSLLV